MTSPDRASLLLIYTGGTIGMKQDLATGTLRPFDFSQILAEVPELSKFAYRIDTISFDPLIDSSDVEPAMWQKLALLIQEKYEMYDGFVILHGTDTMAYSASALSFMLEDLSKPVVFTGSQLPVGVPRTDGKENLVSAVEIAAAKDDEGHARVPEVSVCFDNRLLRGNRAVKVSSDDFHAFRSPDLAPLAEAGISIRYNIPAILRPASWDLPLKVHTALDTRVSILKIHPGITPEVVRHFLCAESIRAVILESYGSGNAPAKEWFLDLVRESASMGKIILNVTQCVSGTVDMGIYANGKTLQDCGVIGGRDITTEAALGKLFHLMGTCSDKNAVEALLGRSLRGEISE